MFTGIIEEKGKIANIKKGAASSILTIQGDVIFSDLKLGDSVAVNGVCLTASSISGNTFTADVMHETLDRSGLGKLRQGSSVNLERAMAAEGRFGGHIVSGHIDGTGTIKDIRRDDNAVWYTIDAPSAIMKYIVEKGSITIDGISLTVAAVGSTSFKVSIIPHTASVTTLGERKTGDSVNLENDIIGKYVEKLLVSGASGASIKGSPYTGRENNDNSGGLTMEFLRENGF